MGEKEMLSQEEELLLKAIKNKAPIAGLTHDFFPYPARFPPSIPRYFISNFSSPKDLILDPFCGSGTTLVEASILERNSVGIDLNPLAVFLSKVKTTPISVRDLKENYWTIYRKFNSIIHGQLTLHHLRKEDFEFDEEKLFSSKEKKLIRPNVRKEILCLYEITSQLQHGIREFYLTCLASSCNILADRKGLERKSIKTIFFSKAKCMIDGMNEYNMQRKNVSIKIYEDNAENVRKYLFPESVDLVVTSPPYHEIHVEYPYLLLKGRQVSKLFLKIFGLKTEVSSSDYTMKKGQTYFSLFEKCLKGIVETLKTGRKAIIVVGFKTAESHEDFVNICLRNNLILERKYDREIPSRKWFTSLEEKKEKVIPKEYVFIFRKV
jgi:site-specific DNA-methyltransferase (cytosine-N4-specific)